MIRRERKFYSEEFRERVLTAYYNSNKSFAMIARRFQVKRDTVSSWVYRKRLASNPKESSKIVEDHERYVEQRARKLEQARLKEVQAESTYYRKLRISNGKSKLSQFIAKSFLN